MVGVEAGDEVITSPYSFVASANCAIYMGADPVFADIDPDTLNLSPEAVEAAITPRTKAVVAVDIFGYPCEIDELRAICDRHGLALVEDSCEALGARYKGQPLGSHGHLATWAFYPNKQITTGEGGAVTTASAEEHELLVSLRNQGRLDSGGWLQHGRLGFNYRLDDISAALGIGQLERLDRILEARREVADRYTELLTGLDVELPLPDDADHERSWFVYAVKLPAGTDRDARHGPPGRRGNRLRPVPPVDPPPAVHARALRLLRGALPGQRGCERADDGDPVPHEALPRGSGARRRRASHRARSRVTGRPSDPRPTPHPRPRVGTHPSALNTNSTPEGVTCLCRFPGARR